MLWINETNSEFSWYCRISLLFKLMQGPEERHKRMVELNVIEQCLNLFKTSAWPKRRRCAMSLVVVFVCWSGWY